MIPDDDNGGCGGGGGDDDGDGVWTDHVEKG